MLARGLLTDSCVERLVRPSVHPSNSRNVQIPIISFRYSGLSHIMPVTVVACLFPTLLRLNHSTLAEASWGAGLSEIPGLLVICITLFSAIRSHVAPNSWNTGQMSEARQVWYSAELQWRITNYPRNTMHKRKASVRLSVCSFVCHDLVLYSIDLTYRRNSFTTWQS